MLQLSLKIFLHGSRFPVSMNQPWKLFSSSGLVGKRDSTVCGTWTVMELQYPCMDLFELKINNIPRVYFSYLVNGQYLTISLESNDQDISGMFILQYRSRCPPIYSQLSFRILNLTMPLKGYIVNLFELVFTALLHSMGIDSPDYLVMHSYMCLKHRHGARKI